MKVAALSSQPSEPLPDASSEVGRNAPAAVGPQPQPTEVVIETAERPGGGPAPPASASERLKRYDWPGAALPLERRHSLARRLTPPWLVSGILHALTVIALGLWVLGVEPDAVIRLETGTRAEDVPLESLDLAAMSLDTETNPLPVRADLELPAVEDPLSSPAPDLVPDINLTESIRLPTVPTLGDALSGRQPGRKEELIAAGGGTPGTMNAVRMGLEWLARQQKPNGYWSMQGPYANGAVFENRVAGTALAMLAFLGDGHTHQSGNQKFQQRVAKGLAFLRKQQEQNGSFYRLTSVTRHRLYTDALCTIVFCELYAMTGDDSLRVPAQRAIDFGVFAQDRAGGWKYEVQNLSDLSVTGWWVMALQSGRMGGLNVPDETLYKVDDFLNSVAYDEGSQYFYENNQYTRRGSLAMSAEGLLCRQYRGWARDDPRMIGGAEILAHNPIAWSDRNCYYWYYATQVLHNLGGQLWTDWNDTLRVLLPAQQVTKGAARGSWDPGTDTWGRAAGRLYVTCLHLYMLEVYYRHLPLYGGQPDPPKFEFKFD